MSISKWVIKVSVQWQRSSTAAFAALSITTLVLTPASEPKAWGQIPEVPGLDQVEQVLAFRATDEVVSGAVRLDGYKLFEIAVPTVSDTQQETSRTRIKQRIQDIQERLDRIAKSDFDPAALQITTEIRKTQQGEELPVIKVNGRYLMTVTALDADIHGSDLSTLADDWSQTIKAALIRAKQERQPEFLKQQGAIAGGIVLAIILGSLEINQLQRRLKARRQSLLAQTPTEPTSPFVADSSETSPMTMAMMQDRVTWRQQRNLVEVQRRLLQVGQLAIWGGGTFFVLGLFPHTRWLQPLILAGLEGPLKVIGIGLGAYITIRISAVLIDRFFWALQAGEFLPPKASQRLALRISTFSLVLKRTIAVILVGIGTLGALSATGLNVAPLLAGVGIIGLALSFASQNLIKDVINGFFILLEDQYAVGDVIVVGDVGGFVENMNLRITQLRNDEGRLITIRNSEIAIVENLSKDWSRVDLKIYIAYDADLNQAFDVIEQVGLKMSHEQAWRKKILESPEVLGVDELEHTGIMIRVWIKTQPLEQWNVAREYRRRLKLALDQQGISIGIPQQSILFKKPLDVTDKLLSRDDGQEPQQGATHLDSRD
jgi:small conductance mechanosensitive channel